jgi:hypothetical protein
VPVETDLESELPDPTTLEVGDYFFIQDMDVTAAGRTGRAWVNYTDPTDTNTPLRFYKVFDQYYSADGETIDLNAYGAMQVKAGSIGAAQLDEDTNASLQKAEEALPENGTAQNSLALGGVNAANYARKDQQNTFSQTQTFGSSTFLSDGQVETQGELRVLGTGGITVETDGTPVDIYASQVFINDQEAATKLDIANAQFWSMTPDYANMETVNRITANNGTWTADRNGFVRIGVETYGGVPDTHYNVLINNKQTFSFHVSGQNGSEQTVVIPVKTGDVIRHSWGTTSPISILQGLCYFIPPVQVPVPSGDPAQFAKLNQQNTFTTTQKIDNGYPLQCSAFQGISGGQIFQYNDTTDTLDIHPANLTMNGRQFSLNALELSIDNTELAQVGGGPNVAIPYGYRLSINHNIVPENYKGVLNINIDGSTEMGDYFHIQASVNILKGTMNSGMSVANVLWNSDTPDLCALDWSIQTGQYPIDDLIFITIDVRKTVDSSYIGTPLILNNASAYLV